jgi:hypothetical protein
MSTIHRDTLAQSWVHSHEEDTANQAIYRLESFAFPPSRGRRGFELKPDGTMIEFGPGPADRTASRSGRWEVGDDGQLIFYPADSNTPSRVTRIISLSEDKLVLEKRAQPRP